MPVDEVEEIDEIEEDELARWALLRGANILATSSELIAFILTPP